jgi:nucleoside triphosphate pyrophosphatase
MRNIILASGSPRRKQLLEWAEVPFHVISPDTDETFDESLSPEAGAIRIAVRKAETVQQSITSFRNNQEFFPGAHPDIIDILDKIKKTGQPIPPILAADTIVVIDGKILGKPANETEASVMLKELSGKTHLVITGVCILYNHQEIVFADTTEVEFHDLTDQQIDFYIEKYKPYDKAGAYAIQEWIGVTGIKSIDGDFYNVMGLPVSRVLQALKELFV